MLFDLCALIAQLERTLESVDEHRQLLLFQGRQLAVHALRPAQRQSIGGLFAGMRFERLKRVDGLGTLGLAQVASQPCDDVRHDPLRRDYRGFDFQHAVQVVRETNVDGLPGRAQWYARHTEFAQKQVLLGAPGFRPQTL